jgi:hypothetical protein
LFSVSDSLSGSLFSVNDISGLPVLEAFSDNRILLGSYQAPALYTSIKTILNSGSTIIYNNIPTASYDSAFFEYTVRSGSNARAGQIMSIFSGDIVNYTEVVTLDFGDTTSVNFGVLILTGSLTLTGSVNTNNWVFKSIVKSI